MPDDVELARRGIARALSARGAHLEPTRVVAGLDWRITGSRPDGASHSIYQLVNHMVFWQDWVLAWLDGRKPTTMSGGWRPEVGPTTRKEWDRSVERFTTGLAELRRRAQEGSPFEKKGRTSRLEMLHTAASHNSYHAGQIVMLRRILGCWPPSRRSTPPSRRGAPVRKRPER